VWLSTASKACSRTPQLQAKPEGAEPTLGAGELYPPNDKAFTMKSEPWISPWTGNFVALGKRLLNAGVAKLLTLFHQVVMYMMVE
jgi:hypothetical protein